MVQDKVILNNVDYTVMHEPSIVMLLLSAITVLGGVIVYLALYIRKLHNRQMDMAIKFTETTQALKASIDINTKVTTDLHHIMIDKILRH
jgi:hypothetical protein